MRTRIVLVLIGFVVVFSTQSLLGKKTEADGKLSVRQQVDSEVHNLLRNLDSAKKPEDSWKAIEKTEKAIQSLRTANPRQFETDEIYMDTLVAGLDQVPRKAEFKKEKCDSYRTAILATFEPQGDPEKPDPPIDQVLNVLKALCR